jgi:TIR domain
MPRGFDANAFNRQIRAAQRKAEQDFKRQVSNLERDINAQMRKANADLGREIDRVNQRNVQEVANYNRRVDANNRAADRNNKQVVAEMNRRLRNASSPVRYTPEERVLADRVHEAIAVQDARDYDIYLSYAQIDGAAVATELRDTLEDLKVAVWLDQVAIRPGQSQGRQMDRGLTVARSGVVVLTPAFVAGRFWTERELGVLLSKPTLIPVLHGVTWDDVRQYSGILTDLAGFSTARDAVTVIAEKIAAAVLPESE